MTNHNWTYEDDILVCYLYLHGLKDNLISLNSVSRCIGFDDIGSVRMRIQNFQAYAGQGKLNHISQLTERVYEEYKDVNQELHRKKCLEILQTV